MGGRDNNNNELSGSNTNFSSSNCDEREAEADDKRVATSSGFSFVVIVFSLLLQHLIIGFNKFLPNRYKISMGGDVANTPDNVESKMGGLVAGSVNPFPSGKISRGHGGTSRFEQMPIECRVEILNFLDLCDLDSASFVSKSLREDCFRDGIQKKIRPVYEISTQPISQEYHETWNRWRKRQDQATVSLLEKICWNQVHNRERFSRYPLLNVCRVDLSERPKRFETSIRHIQDIRINGVLYLDVSLAEKKYVPKWFIKFFLDLLPNLREIKLSNIVMYGEDVHDIFFRKHPLLQKFTALRSDNFWLHGGQFSRCNQLQELILDGSELRLKLRDRVRDRDVQNYSNLTGQGDSFIFCECKFLARLSIRNAVLWCPRSRKLQPVPQNALIKFVRKAPPSLRWFRSDLTPENIRMLRIERPEVWCC